MKTLKAETVAIISDIRVAVGDTVPAGAVLLVTELMKMQHEIRADVSGIVHAIYVAQGDEVEGGTRLVTP